MPPIPPEPPRPRRSNLSLATLLLLTIVVAIFAGSLRIPEKVDWEAIVAAALGGLCLGVFVSGLFLTLRHASLVGCLFSLAAGMLFGPLAGMLLVMPQSLLVIAGGSLILLLFAATVRKFSSPAPEEQWEAEESVEAEVIDG
jgi:hypothetical protein